VAQSSPPMPTQSSRKELLTAFARNLVARVLQDTVDPALEWEGPADEQRRHRLLSSGASRLPVWAILVLTTALVRSALVLALYLSADRLEPFAGPLPLWGYAVFSVAFLALGASLIVTNRRDRRAAWLGGVLILTGTPFATPLLLHVSGRPLMSGLFYVRPDAFVGAFLWAFARSFPSELPSGFGRSVLNIVVAAVGLVGLWCAAANVLLVWPATNSLAIDPRSSMLVAAKGGGPYWAIVLGVTLPALPVLFWRARAARGAASSPIRLFVRGLLAGGAPITLDVFLEEMWPAYKTWAHHEAVEPFIAAIVFGALATIPFTTAYSVLFDEIVETRVVLRSAVRYALARYTILGVTSVPFVALAIFVVEHQDARISSLLSGPRPILLGSSVALGSVLYRMRAAWLDVVDRRYFREAYDAKRILTRVVSDLASQSEEAGNTIRLEIEHAVHAKVDVFLSDQSHWLLRHAYAELPPLSLRGTLASLVLGAQVPMEVDLTNAASPLRRLADDEQAWLVRGGFSLLVPIRGVRLGPLGLLALGAKQSGLPYSMEDRRFLAAVASAAGLGLENDRLSGGSQVATEAPARECSVCGQLTDVEADRCACGGALTVSAVPRLLRGVFRFEQRIGEGGMGVVYRGVDLNLRRDVAIKALPKVTPEAAARLRREARAMAAVTHTNLAAIYGMETWQGTPLLIQEYLDGGTLSARLARSRMAVGEALDAGITLARLLDHLHARGIIHCDIKPSNIGFTRDGVLKLLDFGIVRMLRDVLDTGSSTRASSNPSGPVFDTTGRGSVAASKLVGTPQYMSPEAVLGENPAPSFDLWALAVVLFEALAGRRPFDGKDPHAVLAEIVRGVAPDVRVSEPLVPAPLAEFLTRALSRDLAGRPETAGRFASELFELRMAILPG
jgi:hypothetical protein